MDRVYKPAPGVARALRTNRPWEPGTPWEPRPPPVYMPVWLSGGAASPVRYFEKWEAGAPPDLLGAVIEDETPPTMPRTNRYHRVVSITPTLAREGWGLHYSVAVQLICSARCDKSTAETQARDIASYIGGHRFMLEMTRARQHHRTLAKFKDWRYHTDETTAYADMVFPVAPLIAPPVARSLDVLLSQYQWHNPIVRTAGMPSEMMSPT